MEQQNMTMLMEFKGPDPAYFFTQELKEEEI